MGCINKHVLRDDNYVLQLKQFIDENYPIKVLQISKAKRGFWGETWKINTHGASYFAKIDYSNFHKPFYEHSLTVIEHMNNQGISCINSVLKTSKGRLSANFNNGVIALFDYVYGDNTEDYDITLLFEKLALIYKISTEGVKIQKETFDVSYAGFYFDSVDKLKQLGYFNDIVSALDTKFALMKRYEERLTFFAEQCKRLHDDFFLTHGDAGGNVIIQGNNFTIVDWDYPMLAPIERDAWFFMHDRSLLKRINGVLHKNGVNYTLNIDRLAYYAYFSFFYYFHECFACLFEIEDMSTQIKLAKELPELFDCWISKPLLAADELV